MATVRKKHGQDAEEARLLCARAEATAHRYGTGIKTPPEFVRFK